MLPSTCRRISSLNDLESDVLLLIIKELSVLRYGNSYKTPLWKPVKPLSMVNKRIRELCLPVIYRRVFSGCEESKLREQLREIQANETILNSVSAWKLYPPYKNSDDNKPRAEGLGSMLRDTLIAMPRLTELHLNWRYWDNADGAAFMEQIRTALKRSGSQLPMIKTLSINNNRAATSVIQACNNLENLILSMDKYWKKTLSAMANSTTLKFVEVDKGHEIWTTKQIDEFQPLLKNLEKLCFKGRLSKTRVSDFAQSFSKYPSLTELAVEETQWIDVARLERMGYGDSALYNKIEDLVNSHHLNEDHENLATAFFTASPQLQTLRVLCRYETEAFDAVKDEAGKLKGVSALGFSGWWGVPTIINWTEY